MNITHNLRMTITHPKIQAHAPGTHGFVITVFWAGGTSFILPWSGPDSCNPPHVNQLRPLAVWECRFLLLHSLWGGKAPPLLRTSSWWSLWTSSCSSKAAETFALEAFFFCCSAVSLLVGEVTILSLGPSPWTLAWFAGISSNLILAFFSQKVSSSAPAQLLMYATFWLFAVIVRNAILDFASFYQSPHYCISSSCPFQGGMVPVDPLLLPLQPQAVLLWLLQLLLHLHELLPASLAVVPCTVGTGLGSSQAPGL